MKLSIEPLGDKVIVLRIKPSDVSSGGIHLPAGAQEKTCRGKVVSAGPGMIFETGIRRKPQVKKGDIVIFLPNTGSEIKVSGTEYLIMREMDIMAVVRGEV